MFSNDAFNIPANFKEYTVWDPEPTPEFLTEPAVFILNTTIYCLSGKVCLKEEGIISILNRLEWLPTPLRSWRTGILIASFLTGIVVRIIITIKTMEKIFTEQPWIESCVRRAKHSTLGMLYFNNQWLFKEIEKQRWWSKKLRLVKLPYEPRVNR